MKKHLKETTYNDILRLNGNSRFKTDRVIEYYLPKNKLMEVNGIDPSNQRYVVNFLVEADLKYRSVDFEPPIGTREWIAWGLLLISILSNVIVAVFIPAC